VSASFRGGGEVCVWTEDALSACAEEALSLCLRDDAAPVGGGVSTTFRRGGSRTGRRATNGRTDGGESKGNERRADGKGNPSPRLPQARAASHKFGAHTPPINIPRPPAPPTKKKGKKKKKRAGSTGMAGHARANDIDAQPHKPDAHPRPRRAKPPTHSARSQRRRRATHGPQRRGTTSQVGAAQRTDGREQRRAIERPRTPSASTCHATTHIMPAPPPTKTAQKLPPPPISPRIPKTPFK
jgi:hypothetical protein